MSWGPVPLDGSFPHRPYGWRRVVRGAVVHCQLCGRRLWAVRGRRRLYWRHGR